MDLARRLEVAEQENDLLRARIAQLERALFGVFTTPIEWALTPSERCVFGVLVTRRIATKEALMTALYRDLQRDEPAPKIVDIFIHKLRRKVAPYGVHIETVWGTGYMLDEQTRAKFAEAA